MVWFINVISSRKSDWQLWYVPASLLFPPSHLLLLSSFGLRTLPLILHPELIAATNGQVEKYDAGHFGACPRVFCHSTHVLPCGRADIPGLDTIKLYCPNCGDIYSPPSSKYASVDGEFSRLSRCAAAYRLSLSLAACWLA